MNGQLPLFPVAKDVRAASPRAQLYLWQAGACAGCERMMPPDSRVHRDLDGRRIGALVCRSCSNHPTRLPHRLPVHDAPPLLRLRLTQGPVPDLSQATPTLWRDAHNHGRWDDFDHPLQALWAHQGGTCALQTAQANRHATGDGRRVILDTDHDTGLVLGLVCQRCLATDGKTRTGALTEAWRTYRKTRPGQACRVTVGLTGRYLATWNRDAYNNHLARRARTAAAT